MPDIPAVGFTSIRGNPLVMTFPCESVMDCLSKMYTGEFCVSSLKYMANKINGGITLSLPLLLNVYALRGSSRGFKSRYKLCVLSLL